MRRMTMKKIFVIILIVSLIFCLTGCYETDATNLYPARQDSEFKCEHRVTVYNTRTDSVIFIVEGCIDIETNKDYNYYNYSELIITVEISPNTYKKFCICLNDYTIYVVEDITGEHINDPYHYKVYSRMYEYVSEER